MKQKNGLKRRLGALLLAALLAACGGGGVILGGGIGGTGIVFGVITGFGSIYVNGLRYDTANSEFDVDGDLMAGQGDLSVGMVVRLEVELDENGGFTERATRVKYDDEIQGPVAATPLELAGSGGAKKQFQVFGQTVTIDAATTIFDGLSFASIAADDVVEVSGFRTAADAIVASYVKKRGELTSGFSEVELRGRISLLTADDFTLGGVRVVFDNATEIEVDGGLADDKYVEVEGIYDLPSQSIIAEKIESEDEGFGDNVDEISLQGLIANFVSIRNFSVNGVPVNAANAELSPANAAGLLGDGVNVEVEGEIVGGILIAEKLELRSGTVELATTVSGIDLAGGSFALEYVGFGDFPRLGTITVETDTQTLFEDEDDSGSRIPVENLSLQQLVVGDYVEVEGLQTAIARVRAQTIKRSEPDSVRIQGAVQSFVTNSSITILGIRYSVNTSTRYADGGQSSTVFFTGLSPGDIVEIEDDDNNGFADDVERED